LAYSSAGTWFVSQSNVTQERRREPGATAEVGEAHQRAAVAVVLGPQLASGRPDFFFGYCTDVAKCLGDDQVRPKLLQNWQVQRV